MQRNEVPEILFKIIIPSLNVCFYLLAAFYCAKSYSPSGQTNQKSTPLLEMPNRKKKSTSNQNPVIDKDIEQILEEMNMSPQTKEKRNPNPIFSSENSLLSQIEFISKESKTDYVEGVNEANYPQLGDKMLNLMSPTNPTEGLITFPLESPNRSQRHVFLNKNSGRTNLFFPQAHLISNRPPNEGQTATLTPGKVVEEDENDLSRPQENPLALSEINFDSASFQDDDKRGQRF